MHLRPSVTTNVWPISAPGTRHLIVVSSTNSTATPAIVYPPSDTVTTRSSSRPIKPSPIIEKPASANDL